MSKTATQKPPFLTIRITKQAYLQVLVISVALYILLPQLGRFNESRQLLANVSFGWLALSIAAWVASLYAAALIYVLLSTKKLRLGRVALIQIASAFTNRLLPAGLGAMGTSARFLYRSGYKFANVTVLIAANQLVNFLSLVLIAVFLILSNHLKLNGVLNISWAKWHVFVILILGACVAVTLWLLLPKLRSSLLRLRRDVGLSLRMFKKRPLVFCLAVFCAVFITLLLSASLYFAVQSIGAEVGFIKVLLVYMGGAVASSITPTPGGLGGVEAALVTGFTVIGLDSSQALAGTLAYRLVSFWLPLAPGYLAFRYAISRKLL